MKLSTRFVLLTLGCLLPMLAAQAYLQLNLNRARHDQVGKLVLRQAELASMDIGGIVDGVRQLGTMLAQFPGVPAAGPKCAEHLTSLQHDVPRYRFLGIYGSYGGLVCGSTTAPGRLPEGSQRWAADLATSGDVQVGRLAWSSPEAPFLPMGSRIPNHVDSPDFGVLVAALDPNWLTTHLETVRADQTGWMARTTLMLLDRDGAVIARVPAGYDATGQASPAWARPLAERDTRGVETVTEPDGRGSIAAYVPAAPGSNGIAVIGTMALPDLIADIEQETLDDRLVIGGGAIVALILAWAAGRRFIHQPAEALLLAVRKWREGDWRARVAPGAAGAGFTALTRSLNALAAGLEARDMQRALQSDILEAQVAERTRELAESNNRLQVEIVGREKTEAALHQAQKLQAVGQLAGGIAHDFNNMLATVLGNLELMERRVSQTEKEWAGADIERMMRLIKRATGAVHRGSQLTSRLLAFSRRQNLATRATDVNGLLRELITLATSTLGRGVMVVPEFAEGLWPAMVDPSQVEAAILNLCLNARDAMQSGGRLTISTANLSRDGGHGDDGLDLPPGHFVRICISDTGSGMTADVKLRAFDPFFTTKGPHGTGLGLSQVYGMARQSGGNAIIDSAPGEGTRVTLILPAAPPGEPAGRAQAGETMKPSPVGPMPADLVLVVDDDNAVRQVTVEMTRDLGCQVAQAADAEQALALVDTLSAMPTLILLDYAMPGMNGLQLAHALRARGLTAPIALVTGYAELSNADIAEAHLAGLLRKPFTIGELHGLLIRLRAVAAETCLEPGLTGR